MATLTKKVTMKNAVWYGPHSCARCKSKTQSTMIVKAGNGAPDNMEYNFTHDSQYPGHKWVKHVCITN